MLRPLPSRVVGPLLLGLLAILTTHAAAVAEDAKIRIGYPSGMNGQVPVVLDKAGIAAKHQLAAEFIGFQYGPPMMEGLASGQLDAVVTSPLPPFALSTKIPGSVKFVASLGHSSHSLLVPKDSPSQSITDLKGRKIGVSFKSESHLDLLIALKDAGLDAKTDVQLVNLQPNELPAALEKGLVDSVVIRQPQTLRLEETLGARRIFTWPFRFASIVRAEYLAKNPDAVKRYIEALKDAVLFIANDPDQAAVWFGEAQRIDPSVIKHLGTENPLYSIKRREDISIEVDGDFRKILDERAAAAQAYGFIKSEIDVPSLLP